MKHKFLLAAAACVAMNAQSQQLNEFVTPPNESRPQVWWHWMDGNITKDGIKKDIDWMKRAGLGGFHHFDAGMSVPQIVDKRLIYMDEGWTDAFRYAINYADSLGMEMAVAASPGWSNTGGPWVSKEDAMKKLTWRETVVKGGRTISMPLPAPFTTTGFFQNVALAENASTFAVATADHEFYKDIAVMAVRLRDEEMLPEAKVTSSAGQFSYDQLTDGDLNTAVNLPYDPERGYSWIQFEYAKPQTIKAVTVVGGVVRTEWFCWPAKKIKHVEVSNDGVNFTRIADIPFGAVAQVTHDIPTTTAKYFRIIFDNPIVDDIYADLNGLVPAKFTAVAELKLHPVARINHSEEKAGFSTPYDMMANITPDERNVSTLSDVVDITKHVDANGNLNWKAPKGNWRIYRFGYSLTGKKNHPAPPEATGLEVTKLDGDAVERYITTYLDMYKEATQGKMGDRGLKYLLVDSYEAGWETWSPQLAAEFEKRRGYSLMPWMPVLTGQIIESTEKSEQFLWDWRKTIGELIAENLYGRIARVVHDRGMKCYFESHENGRLYLACGMEVKKDCDVPMAARWAKENAGGADFTMSQCDIRESASVAHLYGKKLVGGETFTSNGLDGRAYSFYPGNLKPVADLGMAYGLNRFVIHESAHQPSDDKRPGLGLYIFGQWFNRHETWAEQAKCWTDYLARSCYMLSQGQNVADVLYYYGEDNSITGLFANGMPDIPAYVNYDFINADALINILNWDRKKKEFYTPAGARYKLLAIDANARKMSLPVLRKLAVLVRSGALICGQRPEYEPSLMGDKVEFERLVDEIWNGNRKYVLEGQTVAQALASRGIIPDFNAANLDGIHYVHRTTPESEIYWVMSEKDEPRTVTASFRVGGRKPTLWRADDGKEHELTYRFNGDMTTVEIPMVANDAAFIVFKDSTNVAWQRLPEATETRLVEVDTPWKVQIAGKTVTMDELQSFTESNDDDIKYFSGTAVYNNTFVLDKVEGNISLDLGKVGVMAEVIVNGTNLGVLWKAPYNVDITKAVKAGENRIEVRVINLWKNRLIGDAKHPENATTFTGFKFYKGDEPLMPSGLMGPVTVTQKK